MSEWLKQSTAATIKLGPFVDETDGKTAETALTISQADIRLSKNGAAYAQTNNTAGATHDESGEYGVPLDTTDTNTLGRLKVKVHESGALPVWKDFMIVPANVWDSMFGADALQVHAVEISNGLITAASIASDAITDAKVASDVTIASVTGAVGSVTGAVGSVTGAVGSVTGFTAANIATIMAKTDNLPSDPADASVIAGRFDTLDTSVADLPTNAELATSQAAADDATLAAIAALPTANAIADQVWDEAIAGHAGAGSTGAALSAATAPSAATVADAVWDEALSGHAGVGSAGAALSAAGSSGDPWSTPLPGAYAAGTAGHIIGNQDPGAGSGAITWTYTLTNSSGGAPIADADVWVTTDLAGTNLIASGRTNASGVVTFYLDSGTVYVWRQKSGWNFTNPDGPETVS